MTPADRAHLVVEYIRAEPDRVEAIVAESIRHAIDEERTACLEIAHSVSMGHLKAARSRGSLAGYEATTEVARRIYARGAAPAKLERPTSLEAALQASVELNERKKGTAA